ncbi:hypothetical protein Tdes44962_MAKER01543 [Teratosphaeria destructans]|uniref:MYND-type domain-containing protein n=1 Tax=Teratosphaeria destructans TaxID=418781 RepID=A0A9W7W5H2_9PEZI|nr:hypothetical protein Tdes44962_MAKER01543 [Teratosphaeria destructans]
MNERASGLVEWRSHSRLRGKPQSHANDARGGISRRNFPCAFFFLSGVFSNRPSIGKEFIGRPPLILHTHSHISLRQHPGDAMTGSEGGICAGCQGPGHLQCKDCLLVLYCGAKCQKAHWSRHRADCRSKLSKESWKPKWEVQDRMPAFISNSPTVPFGTAFKYLWGNVPAIDVLKLEHNEASGDLRNVVKTITALPPEYDKPLSFVLNDSESQVVARNVILLLLCLTTTDTAETVDCMLHMWYSACIKQSHLDLLQKRIRPVLQEICNEVTAQENKKIVDRVCHFGQCSLRLVLTKEQWLGILAHCDVPDDLTAIKARKIRSAVTMAPSRQDFRDRALLLKPPKHRLSSHRFREHGILVPFGHSHAPFTVPNPTIFRNREWPLMDSADPMSGWSLREVLKTGQGAATNDTYGKLYHYVKAELTGFCQRLASSPVTFELFNTQTEFLCEHVSKGEFARVEVANISDADYLGMPGTALFLGPLLQSRNDNPNATLITLFMNFEADMSLMDQIKSMVGDYATLVKYLPQDAPSRNRYDAKSVKRSSASALVRSHDWFFERSANMPMFQSMHRLTSDRYLHLYGLREVIVLLGLHMKKNNTIVEEWPMGLKSHPDAPGAKEDFDLLLASGHTGCERYVESARIEEPRAAKEMAPLPDLGHHEGEPSLDVAEVGPGNFRWSEVVLAALVLGGLLVLYWGLRL